MAVSLAGNAADIQRCPWDLIIGNGAYADQHAVGSSTRRPAVACGLLASLSGCSAGQGCDAA